MRHPNRLTKREEGWTNHDKARRVEKEIVDAEVKEPHLPSKKRKKKRKPFRWLASICPFCDGTLEALADTGKWYWNKTYASSCECGASVHEDCPCCHKDTWEKDGIYKHKAMGWGGCGFEGARKG